MVLCLLIKPSDLKSQTFPISWFYGSGIKKQLSQAVLVQSLAIIQSDASKDCSQLRLD